MAEDQEMGGGARTGKMKRYTPGKRWRYTTGKEGGAHGERRRGNTARKWGEVLCTPTQRKRKIYSRGKREVHPVKEGEPNLGEEGWHNQEYRRRHNRRKRERYTVAERGTNGVGERRVPLGSVRPYIFHPREFGIAETEVDLSVCACAVGDYAMCRR